MHLWTIIQTVVQQTNRIVTTFFWDFEESNNGDPLILEPDKIISMDLDKETFDPSDFVTWDVREVPWFLKRDWGKFS